MKGSRVEDGVDCLCVVCEEIFVSKGIWVVGKDCWILLNIVGNYVFIGELLDIIGRF